MAESSNHERRAIESIAVEIYDQTYHLRGANPKRLEKLAAIVDSRMRSVASQGNTADSLRVAVLAALNMADELERLEERQRLLEEDGSGAAAMRARANRLSGLLDSALSETLRAG